MSCPLGPLLREAAFSLAQTPPIPGEHGSPPCSPTQCRNTPPAGDLLTRRADRGPFLLCPSDSAVKEHHSAVPRLRPSCNGRRASCPGPLRVGVRSAGAAESCNPPDSIPSDRPKRLTVRNRSGHDGMALAKPSEASAAPESRWPGHPHLLTLQNPAGQAIISFR